MTSEITFSKENLISSFKALSSPDKNTRSIANNYLLEFKTSPKALDLSISLLEESECSIQILGSTILHQVVREKAVELVEDKEQYKVYHKLIFSNLLTKFKQSPEKVIELLCVSMASIMNVGLYLDEVKISDILAFSQESPDNELISLFILANIQNELFEFNEEVFPYEFFIKIKEKLCKESMLIKNFILFLLNKHINNEDQNSKIAIKLSLDLLDSWLKSGLNVFDQQELIDIILDKLILNEQYTILAGKIINESIYNSPYSRFHSNEEIIELSDLTRLWNEEFIKKIINIVYCIKKKFDVIVNDPSFQTNPKKLVSCKIYGSLASIVSVILENFSFMLFFNTEEFSKILLEMLMHFVSCSNRKISACFSEAFNEIREFVCQGFLLTSYNNDEKEQFFKYLITILEQIMVNSRLTNLSLTPKIKNTHEPNSNKIVEPGNLNRGFHSNEIFYLEDCFEEDDFEMSDYNISATDYRKTAEDMIYNISSLIFKAYGDEGNKQYFTWLSNIINHCCNGRNGEIEVKIFETAILILKSVSDLLELGISSTNYLVCVNLLMESQLIKHPRIAYSLVIFLDVASSYIKDSNDLAYKSILFLIEISLTKDFETVACNIIMSICCWINIPDNKIIEAIINYYKNKYNVLNMNSVWCLVKSLSSWNSGPGNNKDLAQQLKSKENEIASILFSTMEIPVKNNKEIYNHLINQINNPTNANKPLISIFSADQLIEIKKSLIKNYHSIEIVLKESYFLSIDSFSKLFEYYYNSDKNFIKLLFNYFFSDKIFIEYPIDVLAKSFSHLGKSITQYFEVINAELVDLYIKNPSLSKVVVCLGYLWGQGTKEDKSLFDFACNNLLLLTEVIIKNIGKIVNNNSDNSDGKNEENIIKIIDSLVCLWNNVIENMVVLNNIDTNILVNFLNTIFDCIKNSKEETILKNSFKMFNGLLSFPIIDDKHKEIIINDICYRVCDSFYKVDSVSISNVRYNLIFILYKYSI